jgi:hypothetical protein
LEAEGAFDDEADEAGVEEGLMITWTAEATERAVH